MNRRSFIPETIFVMLFSLLCVVSAEAHFFSIVPNTEIHEVAVGSTYEAKLSFTEAFLNAEVGWTPADIFSARFVYKDGTETNFPTFERHFVSVDVKSGDQTLTKRRNDYLHAQAILGKTGTVILDARGDLAPRMAYKGYFAISRSSSSLDISSYALRLIVFDIFVSFHTPSFKKS